MIQSLTSCVVCGLNPKSLVFYYLTSKSRFQEVMFPNSLGFELGRIGTSIGYLLLKEKLSKDVLYPGHQDGSCPAIKPIK